MSDISIEKTNEIAQKNNLFTFENDWALILLLILFLGNKDKGDEENV